MKKSGMLLGIRKMADSIQISFTEKWTGLLQVLGGTTAIAGGFQTYIGRTEKATGCTHMHVRIRTHDHVIFSVKFRIIPIGMHLLIQLQISQHEVANLTFYFQH